MTDITTDNETFADIFERDGARLDLKPGALIEATVMDIDDAFVIVNAGLKSEGVIPLEQFRDSEGRVEVSAGDTVEVMLDSIEDGYGATRLSREKARRARIWNRLEEAFENEEVMEGRISGRVKGGFTVDLGGVSTFLPGSLMDVRPVRDITYLEDRDLQFKIIKLDRRRNNVVVSRRAVVEREYSAEREALIKNLTEGAIVKGIVKNLTDYGAFLDLGGLDGLMHITDMAWCRVHHPSEIVSVGDEVEVKVLEYDRDNMRVSLGLKQLEEDPWTNIDRRYAQGARVFGKVTNIADYGFFVEIERGVEGLVHVSEMDWINRNLHPSKVVSTGDEVEVMVLDIDSERRRISLGMKQCRPNPWKAFAEQHQRGDIVDGVVKSITDFGIFVGVKDAGMDGLVHLSDISWDEPGEHAIRNYHKRQELKVMVLGTDVERERIALGIKQLTENAIDGYLEAHPPNSIVEGVVCEVGERSVLVQLSDDVKGAIPRGEWEEGEQPPAEGDKLQAKLLRADPKKRAVSLSRKELEKEEARRMLKDHAPDAEVATATLGEIVRDKGEDL